MVVALSKATLRTPTPQRTRTEILKQKETPKNLPNELDTEITAEEIARAAKNLKPKQAAYSDKIGNEMLKHSINILAIGFAKTFNAVLNSGTFPSCGARDLSPQFLNQEIN